MSKSNLLLSCRSGTIPIITVFFAVRDDDDTGDDGGGDSGDEGDDDGGDEQGDGPVLAGLLYKYS